MTGYPTTVQLLLHSPMLVIGQSATGSATDVDVHTDKHGLPEIPRERLGARLRDAALSVVTADESLGPVAVGLLGAAGQPRTLRIGSAMLDDQARAAVAQTLDADGSDRPALIAAITAAYTDIEYSTAIDRFGAPSRNTLRSARVLRAGLQFTARLWWAHEPDEDQVRCLARMVLALRQLGSGEHRGRGEVIASLDGNRERTRTLASLANHSTSKKGGAS